ncbi:MAG: carboxypeptidase regulatory-like domain-containing protein [Candidatus Kuenenia sp.]|nr:carboxypeptidase regulatory-like domain-containing protein [Candidatus Kuenenia hertensis]
MLFKKIVISFGFVGILYGVQALHQDHSVVIAATLTGMITDENGDGIEDAVVTIKGRKGPKKKQKATTDSDGFYEFDDLKKGKYRVKVTSVGYKSEKETLKIEKNTDDAESDFTLDFDEYDTTNDTESMDSAVSAFQEIGTLRKEDPINIDEIVSLYEEYLQDLTQQLDTEYSLSMDEDLLSAMDDIENNIDPKLAGQVIDKTLQRVFYLAIYDRITEVNNDYDEESTSYLETLWDEAYSAYQALYGTADRENKVLTEDRLSIETGSNPNLEDMITVAFIRGKDALKKKDLEEDEITVGVQRQVIRLSLIRSFYIAVLREVESIINNRDTNLEKALEYQKEGEVYYKIIEEYVSRDNPSGNETIKSQLTGDVSEVDADTIVSEMSRGFIGRVEGELDASESNISEGDRKDAMIVAEEAHLYSGVFLEDLELRLGDDFSDDMEEALNELRAVSDELDTVSAASAREVITAIIENYENELL